MSDKNDRQDHKKNNVNSCAPCSCQVPAQVYYMREKPMENCSETEVYHDCCSDQEKNHKNITDNISNPQEFHENLIEMVQTTRQLMNEIENTLKPCSKRKDKRPKQQTSYLNEKDHVPQMNSINLEIHLQIPQNGMDNITYRVTCNNVNNNDVPIMNRKMAQLKFDTDHEETGLDPKRTPGTCGMQPAGEKSIGLHNSRSSITSNTSYYTPQTSSTILHNKTQPHHVTSFPFRKSLSQNSFTTFPITTSNEYHTNISYLHATGDRVRAVGEEIVLRSKRFLTDLSNFLGGYSDSELDVTEPMQTSYHGGTQQLSTNYLLDKPGTSNMPSDWRQMQRQQQPPIVIIYPIPERNQQLYRSQPPSYVSITAANQNHQPDYYSGAGTYLQYKEPNQTIEQLHKRKLHPAASEITLVPEDKIACCSRMESKTNKVCHNLTYGQGLLPTKKEKTLPFEKKHCKCGEKLDYEEYPKCVCNANGEMNEKCELPICIEEAGVCNCDCSNVTDRNINLIHCCNLAIDSNCICMNYYKPKAYKIALPQHRDIKVCIACRFQPSPLINEKGEVFCPGNCGCCLCPWQRRQTTSQQKIQLHDKLEICKCRERGTIFNISTTESICNMVKTFDLCPCREVAEAKFLELYNKDMSKLNEEELDKLRGEPVFLKDVIELRPPSKHKSKAIRKPNINQQFQTDYPSVINQAACSNLYKNNNFNNNNDHNPYQQQQQKPIMQCPTDCSNSAPPDKIPESLIIEEYDPTSCSQFLNTDIPAIVATIDNANICIEPGTNHASQSLYIEDITTVCTCQQYYAKLPDMRTPGPSRVVFEEDSNRLSANNRHIPGFQHITQRHQACTCRDMRTPGPSHAILNDYSQENHQLSSQTQACTCHDMRTPGPSRAIFDEYHQQQSQQPCTCVDMRTPGPSKAIFSNFSQLPMEFKKGEASSNRNKLKHSSNDSEYFSALSNTDDEEMGKKNNSRQVIRKTSKQRNRKTVVMTMLTELLKMMEEDDTEPDKSIETKSSLQGPYFGQNETNEKEVSGDDGVKFTITTQHTSNHISQNNVSEASDRWVLTRTILKNIASDTASKRKEDDCVTWEPGSEQINFGLDDITCMETEPEMLRETEQDIVISPVEHAVEDEVIDLDKCFETKIKTEEAVIPNEQIIEAECLESPLKEENLAVQPYQIKVERNTDTSIQDDTNNSKIHSICCNCREMKEQGNAKETENKEKAAEIRQFIDSLLCDMNVMKKTERKLLCRIQKPCYSEMLLQLEKKKKLQKNYTGVPPESFPVKITTVKVLGKTSLFVKWIIYDCTNIGGYEIYVDSYLVNRYFNGNHSSTVICNVVITECLKITVVAQRKIEEVADGPNNRCSIGNRKWIPSIYLYDPHITS